MPSTESPVVEPQPSETARTSRTGLLWLRALAVGVVAAVAANTILNAPLWFGVAGHTWLTRGLTDWRGLLTLGVVMLLLIVVTRRVWTSVAIVVLPSLILSITSSIKLDFLGEPFVASDAAFLETPGLLLELVPWWVLPLVVVGSLLVVALALVVDRRFPLLAGVPALRWSRWVAGVSLFAVLAACYTFGDPHNPMRWAWEKSGAKWAVWANDTNARMNGFVGALLSTMPVDPMEEPEEYSKEAVEEIADRYRTTAVAANAARSAEPWNVVVVLSETFADPVGLEGLSIDGDPLRAYRRVAGDGVQGEAAAVSYGSGTSTMEFESLTGQSIGLFSAQVSSPYQSFVSGTRDYPSAVDLFNRRGYRTLALHSSGPRMYRRTAVYHAFGFDEAVFDRDMTRQDKIGRSPFISDEATFAELLDHIEESDEPLFANVVTMQNHLPLRPWYGNPFTVEGPSDSDLDEPGLGIWARGLAHSGRALEKLVDTLKSSPEPTAIVYYGDHFPAAFGTGGDQFEGDGRMYRTPMMLWANRPLPDVDDDLGTLGPQYFLPSLFDRLNLPAPPFYALLNEVRREIGTIHRGSIVSPTGEELQVSDLDSRQRRLLEDYRLIQYDLSVGRGWSTDVMWSTD